MHEVTAEELQPRPLRIAAIITACLLTTLVTERVGRLLQWHAKTPEQREQARIQRYKEELTYILTAEFDSMIAEGVFPPAGIIPSELTPEVRAYALQFACASCLKDYAQSEPPAFDLHQPIASLEQRAAAEVKRVNLQKVYSRALLKSGLMEAVDCTRKGQKFPIIAVNSDMNPLFMYPLPSRRDR